MNLPTSNNSWFSIYNVFKASAQKFPQRLALCINEENFTYRQILDHTKQVYAGIQARGARPLIGIYCQDSVWTYAALLAISATGACYVPLNPLAGESKLKQQVEESGLELIVCNEEIRFLPAGIQLHCANLPPEVKETKELLEQDLAYLLYTSGSTGEPKGVPVKSSGLSAFVSAFSDQFDFNERDRFLQPYELSWDVSVACIITAWRHGASLYAVPSSGIRAVQIFDHLLKYSITVSSMVPSALAYMEKFLGEMSFPNLRYAFFAGEVFHGSLAARFQKAAPETRIYNYYGPTEATIYASAYAFKNSESEIKNALPIGQLLNGFDFCIQDENGNSGKNGKGLLFLSGPQVIDAYLNGKDQSAFIKLHGKNYYNTGDLVQLNENGDFEFLGRADTQVKVNGYRVELQEVANLVQNATGQQAIVRYLNLSGKYQLVAFVKAQGESPEELLKKLREFLPSHLCPHKVFTLLQFPLLSNGKTDLARLDKFVHEQYPPR